MAAVGTLQRAQELSLGLQVWLRVHQQTAVPPIVRIFT